MSARSRSPSRFASAVSSWSKEKPLKLDPIECQSRIYTWLSDNFDETIQLEVDNESDQSVRLHFVAFVEMPNGARVAPFLSDDAREELNKLGIAFQVTVGAAQIDIYALQPTDSDSRMLRERFRANALKIKRAVWPVWFARLVVALAFLGICYFSSALHSHWHQYGVSTPLDTMLHHVFVVFIYVGDRLRGVAAQGLQAAAENLDAGKSLTSP